MFLSYFDESGDDGYPATSSPLFILTSIYLHKSTWKSNFTVLHNFRKFLKSTYGMPIKQEFHTKEFITDKNPYHGIYDHATRKDILFHYCRMVQTLNIKIISVIINKDKINRAKYPVLKNALTYNIQRIENDLNYLGKYNFIIITDEGRIGAMTKITREVQKINYIPSQYGNYSFRQEIQNLIEDPLPKNSGESYFIQLADMISFVVNLYFKRNVNNPAQNWSKRVQSVLNYGDEILLMDQLKPRFNLKANSKNNYGLVYYPK